MSRHRHAMPFGATLRDGGGARHALWAPQGRVSLTTWPGGHAMSHPAAPDADGWCVVDLPSARPGDRYQWHVWSDTEKRDIAVPDPASRHNPEGVFGPSVLDDPCAFDWGAAWPGRPWTEAVVYELHVGTFTAEGTFAAAAGRLASLADLGVTCVQLMPVASAPGRFGWGYDGVLPFAPHPAYGTPDDLKRLVQAAHGLGLMVLLDVVYNHFGPSGNFLSMYAPAFFSERHHNAWGDALNFDGPGSALVREFFIHNALYWIEEFQFDGLRLDAVHAMQDDGRPHILQALSARVRAATPGRHVHLVLENDVNDASRLASRPEPGRYDAQWSGDFHHAMHVLMTGETEGYYGEYAAKPLSHLARTLSRGFAREGEPHLADAGRLAENPRRDATSTVPLTATVNFLQNHDQIGNRAFGDRLGTLVEPQAARLATALLLLSPPIPMLFMGEEWGADTPFLYFADWSGDLRDAVVAGRRREFAHFTAFADPQARERIPDPCSLATFERCRVPWERLGGDPRGRESRAHHRHLLALRAADLTPRLVALGPGPHAARVTTDGLLAVDWAFDDGQRLSLRANPSAWPVPADEADRRAPEDAWFSIGSLPDGQLGPWSAIWWWQEAQRP